MKTLTGPLKQLGQATTIAGGATYSVIEIGSHHLTNVTVGLGLDNYLSAAQGRDCTLYLNRGKFLLGLDVDGRSYAIKDGAGASFAAMLLSGFFGILFLAGALANLIDYRYYRGDGTNIVGALFFGVLAFFTVRAFLRNVGVIRGLGTVRSRPGVILV